MVYCSSSLVSKIYQIYHRSSSFPSQYTSGGSRGRVGGPAPPSYLDPPLQHTTYQPHFQVNTLVVDPGDIF